MEDIDGPDPATPVDMTGRAGLVTGASRGIGLAVAAELLRRGAAVTITARKPPELEEAVAALVAGPAAGDADSRADAVTRTVATFGRLDVLVNNAGINPIHGPLVDADLDAVRKIFDVNVVAALGFVQLAHRAWLREHGGAVVNIASIAGIRSTRAIAAYGASKAALIRLTAELAAELGPGIRVNAVAPAVVKTRFATALYAHDEEGVAARYPMKRLGTPADVASLVGFLASDAASWISGETVLVDGGLLATGGSD